MWAGTELNRRHKDFQSFALPTELPALKNLVGKNMEIILIYKNMLFTKFNYLYLILSFSRVLLYRNSTPCEDSKITKGIMGIKNLAIL